MDMEKFRQNLDEATRRLVEFTRTLCYNDFTENFRYVITPNSREVEKGDQHLNEMEVSVLKQWNLFKCKLLTADQVVNLVHHDNKVPLWIDMSVYESRPELTVIDLFCSRRLRDESKLMHPGLPPFHLQVALPPDRLRVEINGKFDVNWKMKLDDKSKPEGFFKKVKRVLYR